MGPLENRVPDFSPELRDDLIPLLFRNPTCK
jgi:hypothetical protein